MKKILLSLGTIGLVATPITTLVSCSDDTKKDITPATPMTMREKVDNALNKLNDITISSKTATELNTAIGSSNAGDSVEISLLGLGEEYSLVTDGLSISYTINTAYDSSTKLVKLNVKISSIDDSTISATKIITVKAKYLFTIEKAAFSTNITSTKTVAQLNAGVNSNSPTATDLGITTPEILATNSTIATYSINNTLFDDSPKAVTVHLTHDGQIDTTTFNLTPKTASFDWTAEKNKFGDKTSSKYAVELTHDVTSTTNILAATLGISDPSTLSPGVTVAYSVDNLNFTGTTAKTVTAHITHENVTQEKTFQLTPATFDFTADKAKFGPLTSSKTATELTHATAALDNLAPTILGISNPDDLTNGLTVTYSVDNTNFTGTTAKTVTAHLTYSGQISTTTFQLTPKAAAPTFDWTVEKNKFTDKTSSKYAVELAHDVTSTTNILATTLGISDPSTLSPGVTVTYSVDNLNFTGTTAKTVTAHITHENDTQEKTFQLTPATFDFSADKAKFVAMQSIKTVSQLTNDATALSNLTPTILGISNPTGLTNGLTVKYSIDDSTFTAGSTKSVTAHLSYSGQTDTTTFDLTPSLYDFTSDKAKFTDKTSTKTALELTNGFSAPTNLLASQLGFTEPALSTGVSAKYSTSGDFTGTTPSTITVHLTHTNGATDNTKTFQLTPKFDFSIDAAQFSDKTSSKTAAELNSAITGTTGLTPTQLGIRTPMLARDVTATYSIVTTGFTEGTAKTITVHLEHASSHSSHTLTFDLTPKPIAFDWTAEKNKFTDKTSSKYADDLTNDASALSNLTPTILGISNPTTLSPGVTVTYSIDDKDFIGTTAKTVTAHITYNGDTQEKTFQLTPATFNFTTTKAKFVDKISSKTATELTSDASALSNLTPTILGISNPTDLIDGLTVTYSINEETFTNGSTKTVTAHLTYSGQIDTVTFKLMPTFDFTSLKAKFNSLTSTKTATTLKHDAAALNNLTPTILGFTPPALPNGVTATYSIDNANFTGITAKVVTVHFTHAGSNATDTTTFDLTPAFDYTSVKASFNKSIDSTKTATTLKHDAAALNNLTPTILGFTPPALPSGVSATYSIDNANFTGTTAKVVTVHFTHTSNSATDTTTFNLKPALDWTAEKNKFGDKTSSKYAVELVSDITSTTNISAVTLGISDPTNLSSGVTVTYSVGDKNFTGTTAKTVTAHITYNNVTQEKTFQLTPATFNFSADKAKFIDKTSSKTATELTNDAAALSNLTPTILGITNPTGLTNGLTVTYSVDDKNFTGTTAKTVTAHLTYSGQTDTATFDLTPSEPFDWTAEMNKFTDKTSSKYAVDLVDDVTSTTNILATTLGISDPTTLSAGVTVTYSVVDTNFIGTSAKTVTAHITYKGVERLKTFQLTPATFDFTADKAKFGDKTSTKTATELNADLTGTSSILATILGISDPTTLTAGITVTYSIPDMVFVGTTAKTVTAYLIYSGQMASTTFQLTPKAATP